MTRVLLAWELGAHLGHVVRMAAAARRLVAQGHACEFAACDLRSAEEIRIPEMGPVFQAPVVQTRSRNPVRVPVSYASLLNNVGFDDITGLAARLRAWRQLLAHRQTELLIADHSPTALLAARTLNLPCLHIGTGFSVPPLARPFPLFQRDAGVSPQILANNEAAVLQNINHALAQLQLPPLPSLQDVIGHAARGVLSYAEIDHYDCARSDAFLGLPPGPEGAVAPWPDGSGPKILAYLRPAKELPVILSALQRSTARVLLRVGDLPSASLEPYRRPGLTITDRAIDMRIAGQECDAYVSYGSHGFVGEMLLAGKPGLLLPSLQERTLLSRRVVNMGAAIVPTTETDFNVSAALQRIVEDTQMHRSAQGFAEKYRTLDRTQVLPRLVDQVMALMPASRG